MTLGTNVLYEYLCYVSILTHGTVVLPRSHPIITSASFHPYAFFRLADAYRPARDHRHGRDGVSPR